MKKNISTEDLNKIPNPNPRPNSKDLYFIKNNIKELEREESSKKTLQRSSSNLAIKTLLNEKIE